MNSLSTHIEYLLTRLDCVVVPGWGAFVVQHTPALFNTDNSITPPRRWISFNSLLNHNDAILAHSVMKAHQCTYDEAMTLINKQVAQWHDSLLKGNNVVLDNIGTFSSQDNASIIFTEAPSSIVNKSLSMLPHIDIPLLADIIPFEAEDECKDVSPHNNIKISWYRRTAQAAAAIAAIVIFMLFISTPIDNFQPQNNFAGLVATEILAGKENHTAPAVAADNMTIDTTNTPTQPCEPADALYSITPSTPHNNTSQSITTSNETPRYILVIGSLPSRTLAEKQIAEFTEMGITEHINIYESNGRYRLYIEGYSNMQQAQSRLDEITATAQLPVTGIWICSTR